MSVLFIDWQHSGKPSHKFMRDRGAFGDFDANGIKEYHEAEAYWTGQLAMRLMGECYTRNVASIMLSDGWYGNRARRASRYLRTREKGVYLALHFNAGGGGYGSCFYDYRSWPKNGPRLASIVSETLGGALPELDTFKGIAATSSNWTKNAFNTIKGAPGNLVGLCLEPAFIDNPAHRPIFTDEGIERIAVGVVDSVIQFNQTRE